MGNFLKLLDSMPKSVQMVLAALALGVGVAYAHESRYMTVSDFTKGYVLELKKAIREMEGILRTPTLSPTEREIYNEELEELIAELCYEIPNDNRYCSIRT